MSRTASIGIDVGGSKTLFDLFDTALKPIDTVKVKTDGKKESDFTQTLTDSIKSLLRTAKKRRLDVSAIGIGCAGAIDTAANTVTASPNIPALHGYSFESVVGKLTKARLRVINDVHAALYGELNHGIAVGYKHVIAVFLGTGLGGAIAIDGKIFGGASGGAGNIGRFLVHPYGLFTGSDRLGILDNFASRTAIAGEAAALATKHQAPHLSELCGTHVENIKSRALAEAIRKGDHAIEELVKSRAQILGIALSNIVDFLNPEMIVLGGGLTQAMPEIIRKQVEAGIKAHATPGSMRNLQVVTAKLKEHAVTIGAATFARTVA
jgi:glucokinase